MSLRKKAIGGLFWNFVQRLGTQGISFLVSLVLARVLAPHEFGLMGMITIFGTIGASLMDSGMTASIIRIPQPDEEDYATVFLINLVASIGIYGLLFLSAPYIAQFFNQPILKEIVRVYFISLVIRAFSMVHTTRLTKQMNFKLQMTISIPSLVIAGVLGIAMAYMGYGVWSLVWMYLVQTLLESMQLWFRTNWTPIGRFSAKKFKQHFSFGYKLTLSGLINTLFTNSYNIIIGKYFSAAQLGFYTMAQNLKQAPVSNLSSVLNQVTYPLFASIHDDDPRLRRIYQKLMTQITFWIAPLLTVGGLLAAPLFRVVLTEKWLPAVPYFQILCIVGIMYPLHAYNLNILKVKGRTDLFLKLEIIKKTLLAVVIIISVNFGIYGLLWGQVIINFFTLFINGWYSGALIDYKVHKQLMDIAPIFAIALLAGIPSFFLYNSMGTEFHDFLQIAVVGIVYLLLYAGISFAVRLPAIYDFKELVKFR